MDLFQIILTNVITLIVGGGLATLITAKYLRAKEKGIAKQENEKGEELEIANTKEIIKLYKEALEYKQTLHESEKMDLNNKISELSNKIREQGETIEKQNSKIEEQGKLIAQNEKSQGQLKLEIESLKRLSEERCEICQFAEGCKKRLAKMSK